MQFYPNKPRTPFLFSFLRYWAPNKCRNTSRTIFTHAPKWSVKSSVSKYKAKWSNDKSHYSANTNRKTPVAQRERFQCLHIVPEVRDSSESEMNWAQRGWKEKENKNFCISHMCTMAHSNHVSFKLIHAVLLWNCSQYWAAK